MASRINRGRVRHSGLTKPADFSLETPNGCLAWFDFNGGITRELVSGAPVLNNATSEFGNLSIDGTSSDYIEIENDGRYSIPGAFTIALQIARRTGGVPSERVFSFSGNSGTKDYSHFIQIAPGGYWQVGVQDSSGGGHSITATVDSIPYDTPQWMFYTFDGTTHELWVDGIFVDSTTGNAGNAEVKNIQLGRLFAGSWYYSFVGIYQNVIIFNRALRGWEQKQIIDYPYLPLINKNRSRFLYNVDVPSSYWGINHYLKHIAGM